MQPAPVNCPHCRGAISVGAEHLGTTISCPHCSGHIALPAELPQAPPAPQAQPMDPHIETLKANFATERFRINDAGNTPEFPFGFSASKVRFDWVGVPTFLEEFFIFQQFDSLSMPELNAFLDSAWHWAIANENYMPKGAELSKKALKFAMKFTSELTAAAASQLDKLSVRQTTCIVYVYAIAIAPNVSQDILDWIWSKESAKPRKDGVQAAFSVPVVYDGETWEFHHFKKRPILGNVYYTEARKVMKNRLLEVS